MNSKILFPVLFAVGLLWACTAPIRVYTDVDESGTFDSYTTYSFMDFTEGNQKTITGMELERIRVAFAREIEQHGLRFVEENGDVFIQITVYHREATDRYYYYPGRYNYMERAIAVDLYDNQTLKHVWHGTAVGELENDPAKRGEELPGVVAKIFAEYPVQGPGAN